MRTDMADWGGEWEMALTKRTARFWGSTICFYSLSFSLSLSHFIWMFFFELFWLEWQCFLVAIDAFAIMSAFANAYELRSNEVHVVWTNNKCNTIIGRRSPSSSSSMVQTFGKVLAKKHKSIDQYFMDFHVLHMFSLVWCVVVTVTLLPMLVVMLLPRVFFFPEYTNYHA